MHYLGMIDILLEDIGNNMGLNYLVIFHSPKSLHYSLLFLLIIYQVINAESVYISH